ncbi:hypothetical protein C8R42DRAFT_714850 [Lentinula raphanica]|nr:hypothetical protein C8R42DRAFT_714850 [Lentinula raphanica]
MTLVPPHQFHWRRDEDIRAIGIVRAQADWGVDSPKSACPSVRRVAFARQKTKEKAEKLGMPESWVISHDMEAYRMSGVGQERSSLHPKHILAEDATKGEDVKKNLQP